MKRRLLLLLPLLVFLGVVFFLFRGLSLDPSGRESALLGREFPSFSLSTLGDSNMRVDESILKGQVSLVNFWASWCPTCEKEMPQLRELGKRGVRLIGVDYKDTRKQGLKFLEGYEDFYEVNIFDPDGDLGFELGVYGIPETFLVDADGIVRYKHVGYIAPEHVGIIMREVEKWR